MENKYFTPDMEDFHIGYECEISTPTIWKSGIVIYDTVIKKELYHWTDYYFDEYIAKNRFSKRIKIN